MHRRNGRRLIIFTALVFLGLAAAPWAQALELKDLSRAPVSLSDYHALLNRAKAATPPRNGQNYVFGFGNLHTGISFSQRVASGLLRNANAAGIGFLEVDNNLDPARAIQGSQALLQQKIDYLIEFQNDSQSAAQIAELAARHGVKTLSVNYPMPDARYFGANNLLAGFMSGSYLAQAALKTWDKAEVHSGYLLAGRVANGDLPVSLISHAQVEGFLASAQGFARDHVLLFDHPGDAKQLISRVEALLRDLPKDAVVMGLGLNDAMAFQILVALQQAGRDGRSLLAGVGAEEVGTFVQTPQFVGSVGFFPENYGDYLVPLALLDLAQEELPRAVMMEHEMITKANACTFYPNLPCAKKGELRYRFPKSEYRALIEAVAAKEEFKDARFLLQ